MWGGRYWGKRYFGGIYWGPVIHSTPPTPTTETQYGYWANRYWGGRYFGKRYWPGAGFGSATPPTPTNDLVLLGGKAYFGKNHEAYLYASGYQKHRDELNALSKKIDEAERLLERLKISLPETKGNNAVDTLAALEAKAQEEINRLLMMRAELIRHITDDEEALIVLYSLPFIN